MSEEATNARKAVPLGIVLASGSAWFFGFILMIAITACINPNLDLVVSSKFGQPMAQVWF